MQALLPAKVVMNNDDGSPLAQGAKVYHANCVLSWHRRQENVPLPRGP